MNLTEAKVQEELYQAKCEIAPRIFFFSECIF